MPEDKREQYKQLLTQARNDLLTLLGALNETQWQTTVISEGQDWSVADIVAHLLENERGMSIHVYKSRQGRETVPADFDVDEWNAGLKERQAPTPTTQLLADLTQVRNQTLEALATIEDHEWNLQGRHPAQGMITIAQYYETIAGHDRYHAADIRNGLGLT